jgi:hypothetical protein
MHPVQGMQITQHSASLLSKHKYIYEDGVTSPTGHDFMVWYLVKHRDNLTSTSPAWHHSHSSLVRVYVKELSRALLQMLQIGHTTTTINLLCGKILRCKFSLEIRYVLLQGEINSV